MTRSTRCIAKNLKDIQAALIAGYSPIIHYIGLNGDTQELVLNPEDGFTITKDEIRSDQLTLERENGLTTLSKHYVVREKTVEIVFMSTSKFIGRQGLVHVRIKP